MHDRPTFTPGPWVIFESEEGYDILPAMRPGAVAVIVGKHDGNANLIVTAPMMYAALHAAAGYLMNAAIDLETGAPKKTALATIRGGLKVVEAAIKAATPPSQT